MSRLLRRVGRLFVVMIITLAIISYAIDSDWEVSYPIKINASSATVWQVLTDLEQYPQWNRYSPNVTGEIAVGKVVWVEAHLDNEVRNVQNYVLSVIPEKELCWQSADWYGFLARGTRCRWLSVTDSGATLMVHHEVMQGPLAWLIEWVYRDRIQRGLRLVNQSVAERAETINENGNIL